MSATAYGSYFPTIEPIIREQFWARVDAFDTAVDRWRAGDHDTAPIPIPLIPSVCDRPDARAMMEFMRVTHAPA